MAYLELVNDILTDLKRPDKRNSVKNDVNKAIAFFVASGTFSHDLVELQHTINSEEYAQSFDITAVPFERFRKIKYIRPTTHRKYLAWRDPAKVFNEDGCENVNVYYRAGNNIVFKLSTLSPTLEIGYYQYLPLLVEDTDTNWMIEQMYPAVREIAFSYSLRGIGNKDEAAAMFAGGMDLFRIFLKDLGDGVSHG